MSDPTPPDPEPPKEDREAEPATEPRPATEPESSVEAESPTEPEASAEAETPIESEAPAGSPRETPAAAAPPSAVVVPGAAAHQLGADGRCYWPAAARPPAEHEAIEVGCGSCGQVWVSHRDMAGFRLHCHCGEWVTVPVPRELVPQPEPEHRALAAPPTLVQEQGLLTIPELRSGETYDGDIPTSAPMAPGTLRHTSVDNRVRWTNRTILEIAGMLTAFYLPSMLFMLFFTGRAQALALPLADLVTGVLVLAIGFTAGMYTFGGLKGARPRFFLEGAGVGLVGAAIAIGWSEFLTRWAGAEDDFFAPLLDELGVLGMLFVVGFVPAVFEELAFRGLLQGRLLAIYGDKLGMVVTGTAFALAHGVTLGFPFHLVGGVYLCWLRRRSDSLYPCMLTHFLYNGSIVMSMVYL